MKSVIYVPSRIGEGYFTDFQPPTTGATDNGKIWAWNSATSKFEQINQISFSSGKFFVGSNTPSADDSAINVGRNFPSSVNSHAFRDESTLAMSAPSTGYASFDSQYVISSNQTFDHVASYQSRPSFSGNGTITEYRGFWSKFDHVGAGTITRGKIFSATNPTGTGVISTLYGVHIEELNRGASNYAFFSAGANTPSYHAGLFQIGGNLRVDSIAAFGAVPRTTERLYVLATANGTIANSMFSFMNAGNYNDVSGMYLISDALDNGAAFTNSMYGVRGESWVRALNTDSGYRSIYANQARLYLQANSGKTLSLVYGRAFHAEVPYVAGSGTFSIGQIFGFSAANQGNSKFPNSYAFYADAQSGSTSGNYAFYSNGAGLNQFGDQLKIVGSGDRQQLIVVGYSTQTANLSEWRNSGASVLFAIGGDGKLKTNQTITNTNTPSGATAKSLPIYNESGVLLGYVPIFASQW